MAVHVPLSEKAVAEARQLILASKNLLSCRRIVGDERRMQQPKRPHLADAQRDLLAALEKTGKPIVLVYFSGRSTVMTWENEHIPAILNVWFGGSEAGDAICDVLFNNRMPNRQWLFSTASDIPATGKRRAFPPSDARDVRTDRNRLRRAVPRV